jgi:hypothetical protein
MKASLHTMITNIMDSEENMLTHGRRMYWANQIILLVRRDENQRIVEVIEALHPLAFDDENEEVRKVIIAAIREAM